MHVCAKVRAHADLIGTVKILALLFHVFRLLYACLGWKSRARQCLGDQRSHWSAAANSVSDWRRENKMAGLVAVARLSQVRTVAVRRSP